jgi:hypothetical protein
VCQIVGICHQLMTNISHIFADKKSISLQLGYNKTKQRGYHPPGFRRMTAAEDLIIPSKEYKSCSNVGSMYTGHHRYDTNIQVIAPF